MCVKIVLFGFSLFIQFKTFQDEHEICVVQILNNQLSIDLDFFNFSNTSSLKSKTSDE